MLTDYNEYLEGVKIWYNGTTLNWRNITEEDVTQQNSHSNTILCLNGSLTNVDNSGSSSYILSGLMTYTQYDIFLMPFYKTLLGKPSNMMSGFTDEGGELYSFDVFIFFNCHTLMFCNNYFSTIGTTPKRHSRGDKRNIGVDTVGATTCEDLERRTYRLFGKFKVVRCLTTIQLTNFRTCGIN